MYVYPIETQAVYSSGISSSLLFNIGSVHHFHTVNHLDIYRGDRAYVDFKHVFAFTSFLVHRIAKSWAGAWERGYAPLICGLDYW